MVKQKTYLTNIKGCTDVIVNLIVKIKECIWCDKKFCSFSDFKLHKNICERNKHALATNSDQIDPEGQSSSVKNETQRENLFSVHFVIASSNLMKN